MKITKSTYGILVAIAAFCSCVKPFAPAVTNVNANILVVEGFINTGGDTTKVVLSRTVTIGSTNSFKAETGATITVEDAAGHSYAVPETTTKGNYASKGALALTSGTQYRFRIKTTGGQTYLSDLVASKIAPPVDSIGYKFTNGGIAFYVNSHDNSNQTIYYLYTFSEAWQFHAKYQSGYLSNGKNAAYGRTPAQLLPFFCYGRDSSANIILNSTAALGKDVVYQYTFNTQSDTSEKFELRYSVLLTQMPLTKDGYAFWQNMQKNTEQLGSIFDVQPSTITGNIHNVNNAAEPIVGYISAGTIAKKRVYINGNTLPSNFVAGYPTVCEVDTAIDVDSLHPPTTLPPHYFWAWPSVIRLPSPYLIINAQSSTGPFTVTTTLCADCTVRGAANPPSFWKP